MMEELVQKLGQKTGLSPDKAQEVVNVVLNHLVSATNCLLQGLRSQNAPIASIGDLVI